ncbi:amidohydrolase family protein [Lysobacter sp. A6]|uniref:Amidohydrolase family protein n=1 Tax=Noviluteimonas lactosilytica TaxID=2888523 RepID=A0ABS8JGM7_9GAMM|nr:amidohydrolase family protein [Lysobacter lactosilyticus]MCC8362752.1 amidohydrolase family protein [Lysobacter lactosilyticus]
MKPTKLVTALLFATLSPTAFAQTVVVHAGRMVDVDKGEVLADRAITIENGRVVRVEPWSEASARNARVIDWSRYTVLPGLMDMHTHVADEGQSADPGAPLKSTPARDAFIGAKNAWDTVRAGFTTVRDVGVFRGFADVALRDAINAGQVPGPRMFVAGAYITIPGGGGEITGLPEGTVVPDEFRRGVAKDEQEVRQKVNALFDGGVDFIKVIATGAVLAAGTEPGESEYTEAQIRAAVEEAGKRHSFVAAHAHGAEGIKRASRAGVRSIEHGSLMDDEAIATMKQHGTWLVADIYNGDYIDTVGRAEGWSDEILRKNTDTTETQRAGFRKAVAAGVNIAYGTDSGVYPHGDNARQFAYMVRYGMTPMQAIQSATIQPARMLGREGELGSIAPGKFADLIAVDGDPIADIEVLRDVRSVIKNGKRVCDGPEECGPPRQDTSDGK